MQSIIIGKMTTLDYYSEEAYKNLRTNLEFCGKDVKAIAITSCIPNEGKSSVLFNLARSIAAAGKRVLVVDADMRKSVCVGRYRIIGAQYGLSHFLAGTKNLGDVLSETNIPNLYSIVAGPIPPNPAELLGANVFGQLIHAARDKFDYVLVDTPPIGSVIDAAVVAKVCDGIALVISANTVSYRFAQEAIEQLKKSDTKILGTILNKVPLKNGGKYYSKYYGKYYGEEKGGKR